MNISDYFDQIYIIHIGILTERKLSIIKHIEEFNLKKISIINALDKNKINLNNLNKDEKIACRGNNYCKTAIINDRGDKCWCKGRGHSDIQNNNAIIACAFGHHFCYKDMVEKKYKRCLILEDDFLLEEDIENIFNKVHKDIPNNWELLYFANKRKIYNQGQWAPDKFDDFNDSFSIINRGVSDACCYAVSDVGAKILYENFYPIRAAADSYLGVCYDKLFKIKNKYICKHDLARNGSYKYVCGNKTVSSYISKNAEYIKNYDNEVAKKKLLSLIDYYIEPDLEEKYLIKNEEIKDEEIKDEENIENKIKEETENNRKINVLSFCLYGCEATYILGMKENVILATKYFPNWVVRIYYNNTVPEKYIKEYESLNAECILCGNLGVNRMNWEGMFWRWLPLDDTNVHFWVSRDADSRLSQREANILKEWCDSDKTLHCIRDHRCHFNYIMGGLFGINNDLFHKRYKFKKVKDIIKESYNIYRERSYNIDQIFLNDKLWNMLRNDVMAHISNGGRKVYDSDIIIKPDGNNFIGKQYKMNSNLIKNECNINILDIGKNNPFKIKCNYKDEYMEFKDDMIKLCLSSNNDTQLWKLDDNNRIINLSNNKFLDFDDNNNCILSDNNKVTWKIVEGGFIINNLKNMSLDCKGGINDRRKEIWLYKTNYSEAQQWNFIAQNKDIKNHVIETDVVETDVVENKPLDKLFFKRKKMLILDHKYHRKNKKGMEMICEYLNYELIYGSEKDIINADIIYCPGQPYNASKWPYKKFIFGPHHSIFPNEVKLKRINNKNNSIYIQPSPWARDVWINMNAEKYLPVVSFPFPVEIDMFKPIKNKEDRKDVFVMYKQRKPEELHYVEKFLKDKKIPFKTFRYGRYDQNDYLNYLQNSKYGIWVGRHESQGFGLQEALSCDIPLLVWNVTNMRQQAGWHGCPDVPGTTIPFWDERCGEYFENQSEFDKTYEIFLNKLQTYKPREFIESSVSVIQCSNNLLKIIENYTNV